MIMVRLTTSGFVLCISVALASLMGSSGAGSSSSAILIRVDPSGKADYKKIQDAIDAVPSNNAELYFIWIKPGIYREKIVIPVNKPFITLSGTKANTTIITGSDGSSISTSATLTVLASNFVARFLTIQNTYGPGVQAVALRVSGDEAAFYGCRILAYQDTLFDDNGRHYYNNCYIEGAIDFICGNALSLFEKCHLHSVSDEKGAITAQRRSSPSENTGFSFINCKVTGVGSTVLGRPWGAYSRVVFARSYMDNVVLPQGWNNWENTSNQRTAFYGEYRCYGPGSDVSNRVEWSHQLSSAEVAPFFTKSMINGQEWLSSPPTHFRRASTTSVEKLDKK